MSKKIYISPIMTSDYYQLQTEVICCSPNCDCGCQMGFDCSCGVDQPGPGVASARARAGYGESEIHEAEFGNLW